MIQVQLPSVEQHRVLVVGDVMLDKYWFGDVDRISPEAPVPIVAVGQEEYRAGGAANVASNVAALGPGTDLLCVTGADEDAERLITLLSDYGVRMDIQRCNDRQTTVKLRVIAQQQQLLRADFDRPLTASQTAGLLPRFESRLPDADVVVLSDYGKGSLQDAAQFIRLARSASKAVLVDPKGRDFSRYKGATVITPNLAEFEAVVGPCDSESVMQEKAMSLIVELELERLLVTRGNRGMTLFEADGSRVDSDAKAREVFDVSGAGDTVIAALAVAYCAELNAESALALANVAAGLVVGRLGTAIVSREELIESLREDQGE